METSSIHPGKGGWIEDPFDLDLGLIPVVQSGSWETLHILKAALPDGVYDKIMKQLPDEFYPSSMLLMKPGEPVAFVEKPVPNWVIDFVKNVPTPFGIDTYHAGLADLITSIGNPELPAPLLFELRMGAGRSLNSELYINGGEIRLQDDAYFETRNLRAIVSVSTSVSGKVYFYNDRSVFSQF